MLRSVEAGRRGAVRCGPPQADAEVEVQAAPPQETVCFEQRSQGCLAGARGAQEQQGFDLSTS